MEMPSMPAQWWQGPHDFSVAHDMPDTIAITINVTALFHPRA
jgi:hypothetical protein